jgi:hypothetical protein
MTLQNVQARFLSSGQSSFQALSPPLSENASEGCFCINHPFGFFQRLQTAQELSGIVQFRQFPEETEFSFVARGFRRRGRNG